MAFYYFFPEYFLIFTLFILILLHVISEKLSQNISMIVNVMGFLFALLSVFLIALDPPQEIIYQALSLDAFSTFFRLLFISAGLLHSVNLYASEEIEAFRKPELLFLILSMVLSCNILVCASHLLFACVAFTLLNMVTLFLVLFSSKNFGSIEAAGKYFIFSSFSHVIFVFICALFFLQFQTMDLYKIHDILMSQPMPALLFKCILGCFFFHSCFHIHAFPSYWINPDLLQGAATIVAGFLGFCLRAAGFAFTIRFLLGGLSHLSTDQSWSPLGNYPWSKVYLALSGISMLCGAFMSFFQHNIKRMIGYLCVFQSGFLLIGLVTLNTNGVAAILYSFIVELFSLGGLFYILCFFYPFNPRYTFKGFRGLLEQYPLESLAFIFFLFCWVGIPPFPGFFSKLALLQAAVYNEHYTIVFIAVASFVGASGAVFRMTYQLIGKFDKSKIQNLSFYPHTLMRRMHILFYFIALLSLFFFSSKLLFITKNSLKFFK